MNFRPLTLPLLSLALASCAQSQPKTPAPTAAKIPLRALIISGGPSPDYNQYAIESNARYLEKLTANAVSRRVLFADGNSKSRTISALQKSPKAEANRVLAWLLDAEEPAETVAYRASGLRRIDGPATPQSIAQNVRQMAREVKPGQRALLFFTGHGSPGRKPRAGFFGARNEPDFENTTYSSWGDREFSERDLASALRDWPAQTPLVLVMVQCHAGGFANVLFEGGDPKKPVLNRDFAGFFAATGERQASGCTSEVDEVDYQDFTTYFFAALSGISRDGRAISGADYDKNGAVSLLEAYAWTNVRDNSIDVPVCTSDAYLRSIWDTSVEPEWVKTPHSQLAKRAAPWQRAILDSLSQTLGLRGENRIEEALRQARGAAALAEDEDAALPASIPQKQVWNRYEALQIDLKNRFPGLRSSPDSAQFRGARASALGYLANRRADVTLLGGALRAWDTQSNRAATREAQCLRFARTMRTLWLEQKLQREGTATQKSTFARIRRSESRNPLK